MFNNNTSYQEAINAPSRRITGNVTIKGQKLSDDISSIDYVSSISGNTLTIGATNASTVDIKFKRLIEGLEEKELIKVSFSVQTSSGIVERQIGEFFLTEIKLDRNNKTTTLKAIDKMAFLNDKYTSTLLYPTLGRNIVQEIANSCNLRVNNNLNITNLPSFSKKLEKVTYREMLGYLAQTVGAFVIFNNNGELEFRKLNRTQKQISKGSYLLKGLEVDEVEYRINGISISLNNQEKTILAVGSPLGTQVKLTNPLMIQGWLNSIFSEYSRLRFNPFKLNWRGDPFVEVGDWVSIEIANGSYRAFPILELKLSYSGGLKSTIGANVKGTTTSTTEYKGTVERQIEFINARLGASGNYVYADTVEPTNPKEGDTWFKPNGAFTDLYIYENNQWVLKTSTGNIEGLITKITDSSVSTQNLAAAIAKIIELDAARITTGSLSFEQLSSNTVSEIRKGMVSETKFNSFVNDSNGLRQQMSSEIERVVESKKSTLKGQDGVSSYIHRKYSDNANGTPMSDNSNLKYLGIYTGSSATPPITPTSYTWSKIKGEDGARGRDGNNGRNGTDGHSLTASLWFTGGYVNNVINDVKLNLKVFYDGREIRDFSSVITYKGGNFSSWQTKENPTVTSYNVIDYTFWSNGEKDGSTLFALATVTYNGLQAVADTRLDNVPNVEDVKETIKKFKTFESTLDSFKSVIGEIKGKEIKTIVNTPNLCTEDLSDGKSKMGNDLYFNVSPSLKANTKYTVIVDVNFLTSEVHQKTKVYGAKSGGGEQWLNFGRNVWVVDYATEQTRVNIYPLGELSRVINVEIYEGDFREFIEQNNRFVSIESSNSEAPGLYSYTIKHNINNAKGKYFLVKFDLVSLPADKWFSSGDGGILTVYLWGDKQFTEELKLKDNQYIIKAHFDDTFYIFHSTDSLKITNVRLYEVRFGVTLATQSSLIDISSMIDQSKEAVTLSAKKVIESKLTNYPTKSELKLLSDRIESSVNTGNFGTTLSQNAHYLRIAWNSISNYVQFEDGGLNFYEGANTQNDLRARIDGGNYTFWRDGYNLGNMGTGYYANDHNKKGVQFHLEYDGWFMGWAYKQKRTDDHYTWKWYYTSGSIGDTYADTLNAGCHTNFRWNEIWYFKTKTSWFNITDGLNGTISVISNIENTGNGGIRWWTRNLTFKNGILIGG